MPFKHKGDASFIKNYNIIAVQKYETVFWQYHTSKVMTLIAFSKKTEKSLKTLYDGSIQSIHEKSR